MRYRMRRLQADEIPLIAGIDRSEELREEFSCGPLADGLGLRLRRQSVDSPRFVPNWSATELASRFDLWRRNLEDGAILIGAFVGDVLTGFVLVTTHSQQATGEISSLFIDRDHRGKGLGTSLLAAAERYCRGRGASTLVLYTGRSASTLDFYPKRGFRLAGIRDPRFATKGFDLTPTKDLRGEEADSRNQTGRSWKEV